MGSRFLLHKTLNSRIANIALISVSVVSSIVLANFLAAVFCSYYATSKKWLVGENQIRFYRYFEDKLNHLREPSWPNQVIHAYQSEENFLFNHLKAEPGSPSVLVSGDSWAEKFSADIRSYNTLKQLSASENIDFVLAGITSYSPTLIGTQIYLLHQEFGLQFDKIIIVLDNTDIGDELCRYRSQRYEIISGVDYVRSFTDSNNMAAYTHKTALNVSEVLNSDNYSIVKILKLAQIKFQQLGQTTNTEMACGWTSISNYLTYPLAEQDKRYIFSRFTYLLNVIKKVNDSAEITFITSPHREHLLGSYKTSMSDLLDEFLINGKYRNVQHYNAKEKVMELLNDGNKNMNDIFIVDDPASHLTSFAHNEIFVPFIVQDVLSK